MNAFAFFEYLVLFKIKFNSRINHERRRPRLKKWNEINDF